MRQFQNATFILDKSEDSFNLQDKKKYDCLMMKFKKYHLSEYTKSGFNTLQTPPMGLFHHGKV